MLACVLVLACVSVPEKGKTNYVRKKSWVVQRNEWKGKREREKVPQNRLDLSGKDTSGEPEWVH